MSGRLSVCDAAQGCFVKGGEFQPNQQATLTSLPNGSQWTVSVILRSTQVMALLKFAGLTSALFSSPLPWAAGSHLFRRAPFGHLKAALG